MQKSKKIRSNKPKKPSVNQSKSSEAPLSKKGKETSYSDKIRWIQPQYFRIGATVLLIIITIFFVALQGMQRVDTLSNIVHYGYIVSILLSLTMPLLGFLFVKRHKNT
ncbi:MAG: hypothetical protein J6N72_00675 [Psychrobacter sp.]|nr:hypothetical protein [Psychrobacter sp.]